MQKLHEHQITAIFNVQSEKDLVHRGVNWPKMLTYYKQRGIEAMHFPIADFNEDDLCRKLYEAAKILNDLINNKQKTVYVHCTAGMGRAPACVLVYLCLYKKVDCWQDPVAVDAFVKSHRKVSVPNLKAVKRVVTEFANQV